MRLANCFKLARLLRLVAFVQNFQKTEYRSAVLFFLMLLFAIAAHWLACIFHLIAILERPNLQVKYSWLDHLAEKYKMPYRK
jgi:potassium voltage-gated channel Eag-related subfamily H member 8